MRKVDHALCILVEKFEKNTNLTYKEIKVLDKEKFNELAKKHSISQDELAHAMREHMSWPIWKKALWFLKYGWW